MTIELLSQLLLLVPTVGVTAVIIRMLVEFCKKMGWVKPDQATLWSLGGNAVAYALLAGAQQLGLSSQVEVALAYVNAHINEGAALLSLLVLAGGSTGLTKLVHEGLKRLNMWWAALGIKEPDPEWLKAAEAIAESLSKPENKPQG